MRPCQNSSRIRQASKMSTTGRFALRFTAFAVFAAILVHFMGARLVETLLPAAKAEIEVLESAYLVNEITYARGSGDTAIRARIHQVQCLTHSGQTLCPQSGAWAEVACPAGGFFASLIVMVATCFAWPAESAREYPWRMVACLLAGSVVWAVDTPLQLWAAAWALQYEALAPSAPSPLLIWTEFLQGGGRMAIAFLLAALSASIIGRAMGPGGAVRWRPLGA